MYLPEGTRPLQYWQLSVSPREGCRQGPMHPMHVSCRFQNVCIATSFHRRRVKFLVVAT